MGKFEIKKALKIKKHIIFVILFGILYQIIFTVIALNINNVFTQIEDGTFKFGTNLIILIILIIAATLISFIYPFASRLLFLKGEKDIDLFLTNNLFKQNRQFFFNKSIGEIINVCKNVGSNIAFYYSDLIPNIIINTISFILTLTIIFTLSYKLTLIIFAAVILVLILLVLVGKKLGIYAINVQKGQSDVYSSFEENLENHRIIKMLNNENKAIDNYKKIYDKSYYETTIKFKVYESLYTCLYSILIFILPLFTLLLGLIIKDYIMISIGSILAIYTLIGNIQEPIRNIAMLYSSYKQNKENLTLIEDYININIPVQEEINNFNILKFTSSGITFNNKLILNCLDFEIKKGDFISLVGQSGAGKSTILKLIMKEITNNNVEISINNEDIYKLNYNNKILCATQENYMFKNTILFNITLDDNFTNEEIDEVIRIVCLDKFIKEHGFNKEIDEVESNVSGGEIARLCLARILLRKPQLLLLDEVTSSLDDDNAEKIAFNINEFSKKYNITVIAISHKKEFVKYSNKIINI